MATKPKKPDKNDRLEQRFGIELPYTMTLRLRGVTPFLFNRMDIEAYDAEGGPGAKRKPRTRPEYESMVWRDETGNLALPTQNVIGSIVSAGKYYKSPIAPSGSATPTLREAFVPAQEYATFWAINNGNGNRQGQIQWDSVDFRHAKYANREKSPKPTYRPRLEVGWLVTVTVGVITPELYGPVKLLEIIARAGSVMGIGDGRKIGFGRYVPDGHEVEEGLPW